jgi:hypothetical protein
MDQINGMQDEQKEVTFSQMSRQIKSIIHEISHLQALLITMMSAWAACGPLPYGWELRVSESPAIAPYWVDHVNKSTQAHPPVLSQNECRSTSELLQTMESMPEYNIYSSKLTIALENLYNCHLQRVRFKTNQQSFGPARYAMRRAVENSIIEGNFLLIFICNFHVLNHFFLTYVCKLHWNRRGACVVYDS